MISRLAHIKVSAPAVVMLATVVNAAAAGDQLLLQPQPHSAPDLAWAVRGDATHTVRTTRAFFAKKAVTTIRSLDQISGAQVVRGSLICSTEACAPELPVVFRAAQQPAHSSHQQSAP